MKKNAITLSEDARSEFENFSKKGKHSVRSVNRAKIILALDESGGRKPLKQIDIAERIGVSRQAVNDAKRDFLEAEDVAAFLQRKKRETPPIEPKVTGELEARIITLACGKTPDGYDHWTLRLLADKCVELQYVDSLSHMSVSRVLKKLNLNLI
jgi:integrase